MMNNDNSSVDITRLCHLRWQPTAKDDSEEVLRSRSLDFFRDGTLPMYHQIKISVQEADIEEAFFALAARSLDFFRDDMQSPETIAMITW